MHGAWHGAWCWDEHFLDYFADAGFAVRAVSLRAHGKSGSNKHLRWTRIKEYVADVAQVAAQLPAPPVVIGHSMGGLVTQKYLESHPAAAGVLVSSVPPAGALATTLRIAARHPLVFLRANLTLSLWPFVGTPALAREMLFSPRMPKAELDRYFKLLQDESYLAFTDMLLSLPRPKRIRVPMLVVGGGADRIFYPHEVEATARAYGTRARLFAGMPHDLMVEAGWEAVAEHIRDWLVEQGL